MMKFTQGNLSRRRTAMKIAAVDDPVSDLKQILLRFFEKPYVLVLYVLVLVLFLTRVDSDTLDVVDALLTRFPKNPILLWISQNFFRVCGALVFLPVVVDTGVQYRTVIAFSLGALLIIFPQRSVFEYFLYSLSLHVYAKAKNFYTRFFVIGTAVSVCMFFGFLTSAQLSKLYSELPNVPTTSVNKVVKVASVVTDAKVGTSKT